jgi:hypothetical protein
MNATDTACGAAIEGSSIRFLCDDSGTADAVPLSEKEKDDENTKSSMAQKAQMLSDWGQSSAAGLFDNVGSLVSHMRRVGRSGKLARRNSTSLIDGKEQKVAGAIYECVMNDDLPITGKLARRGSVSKWKINGQDKSISGAIYENSMKSDGVDLATPNYQADAHLVDIKMIMDTMPNLNKTLCSGTKLFDSGYDLHFVHNSKPLFQVPDGFTGAFNPKTGASIPVFKEKDGFWYIHYVLASDEKGAKRELKQKNVQKMLLDTGANYTLGDAKHVPFMMNKGQSKLSARGAFGNNVEFGDKKGQLQVWVIEQDPSRASSHYKTLTAHIASTEYEPICDESGEVCLTLAEYMQDELFKLNTAEVLGTKNQLGGSFKRMDAYEYHCRLGHRGHFPGCHICQAVARSLKRTYVDRVLYQEVRNLYRFTMDAMVLSNRSFDGKKYAYMFIDMGPSGYCEGFTLVHRSDLCEVFFPMVERLRARFGGSQPLNLFRQLLVDCAGEHISEKFLAKCVEHNIERQLPSTRKENMGLAEITMKNCEMNMKSMMLEVHSLVQDWVDHFENHLFLTVRLPKIKDIKSPDGDAATPLEIASGGEYSRRMCYKDLKSFVNAGTLCHVKTPDIKGSNIAQCARSRMCVAKKMTSGGVMKFMDVNTKAHFRSNDFQIIKIQSACVSWQEYLKQPVKLTRASMPHPSDGQIVQHMRQVNIAEIGSNTREFREIGDLVFEADHEEKKEAEKVALARAQAAERSLRLANDISHGNQVSNGVSRVPATLAVGSAPHTPVPQAANADEVIVSDPTNVPGMTALSAGQQRDLLLLHEDPGSFINRIVVQNWPDHGRAEGIVYDQDDDREGNAIWGIQWGDGTKSDFNINQMRKYCVLRSDGAADSTWLEDFVSDVKAVRKRLTELHFNIYDTGDGDTWSKICAGVGVKTKSAKKAYYEWLSKFHGYGSIKNSDDSIPWMKFSDPYSCIRPRKTTKFQKKVPFPYPSGPTWDELLSEWNSGADVGGHNPGDAQSNQEAHAQFVKVEFENQAKRRLNSMDAKIDLAISEVQRTVKIAYINQLTADPVEFFHASTRISQQGVKTQNQRCGIDGKPIELISETDAIEALISHVSVSTFGEFAETMHSNSEWREQADVFTAAVVKEMATKKDYTEEQLNAFARAPPPKNYEEAMKREDAPLWDAAVCVELAAFDKFDIMEHRVTRTEIQSRGIRGRPIPLKMLFDVKRNDDGTYAKHKVRCILMGHSGFLVSGIHYQETYAPSPDNFSNIFVSALGLTRDWKIIQFDVTTAYLQSAENHNECANLILEYPKGWGGVDENGERYLALLKSPVYGHPTAARSWSKTVTEWVVEFFSSKGWDVGTLHSEPCLFVLLSPDNTVSILIVYVDDCRVQGERDEDLSYIKTSFGERFGIKDVDPRYFLGCLMEVEDQGSYRTLSITQPDFVEDMLIKYADYLPADVKVTLPFEPGTVLGVNEPDYDPSPAEQDEYRAMGALSLAGQLLWLARRAYNVILFSVTQLCAVMSKPSKRMWDSGIRILMWLRDNYKTGIRFYSNGCTEPCIFYDAGHNQYASDSKAHHGNVAVFAGGPVGNDSKKHDDVGDSTPMNEYMALYWAARRGRWWYQLIYEMDNVTRKRGIEPMFAAMIATAIKLYGDNDAATGQAKEKRLTPKSRHTRLKYHLIRSIIEAGECQTYRVPSKDNIADGHSKGVSVTIWNFLARKMAGYDQIFPYTDNFVPADVLHGHCLSPRCKI